MDIKTIRQAIIRGLSHQDINMKKNYKVVRKVISLTHPNQLIKRYKVWDHKIIYQNNEIPVRIYSIDERVRPIIIYFHGGGYVTGNIDTYNHVCANIAKNTGHRVISVDYRLAPEYKFPTANEDCYHAAREIYLLSEELFHITNDQITLMGDSAGATLAGSISLMARDRREFKVSKQILLYPATNSDYSENSRFESVRENGTDYILTAKRMQDYIELYENTPDDRNNPYFTLLFANLQDQPDTLVITAEFDPLRDEGEEYYKCLLEHDNYAECFRINDAMHGFFTLPSWNKAVKESFIYICRFLDDIETK